MAEVVHKTFCNWSGGKDSALALYYAQASGEFAVDKLVTNVYEEDRQVAMHRVPEQLLDQQAAALQLPLQKIWLPHRPSMQVYEQRTGAAMQQMLAQGYTHSLYGDIFLEDLRDYRQKQMHDLGLAAVFPLWKKDTAALVNEFIDLGFKAVVVCVQANLLNQSFAGRLLDKSSLVDLPRGVDPCGENGEFHTFVFDGPNFKRPVPFVITGTQYSEMPHPSAAGTMGFWFSQLAPAY